jgi:archaeal flagellar protein FlaJ
MVYNKKMNTASIAIAFVASLVISGVIYYFNRNIIGASIYLVVIFILLLVYNSVKEKVKNSANIKKMEEVFPDFIELVSSNLRSGMTVDKALLMSSRKEFYPLDEHILQLGKDITTGKEITVALKEMAIRIKSEKINKTISLINSGLKTGGNLAILLEETASNLREREFIEKRAASNVLMYVIFIFFAVAIGAPVLFGLSSVLVKVLSTLLSSIPELPTNSAMPLTLKSVNISTEFITYFSLTFMIVSDILAALLLGLVSKGEEKRGVKYIIPLIALSTTTYLLIKTILSGYFGTLFS